MPAKIVKTFIVRESRAVPDRRPLPPRRLVTAGLLALAILAGASLPAQAASLYWTNINGALPLAVARSDLQGQNPDQLFIEVPGNPYGLFVTSQYVFFTSFEWQSSGFGTIGRANLDGSAPDETFIGGASGRHSSRPK